MKEHFVCNLKRKYIFKTIQTSDQCSLSIYPLRTSEILRFSNVFRGLRKGSLVWNCLKQFPAEFSVSMGIHFNLFEMCCCWPNLYETLHISSVIRQKGEYQNGASRKQNTSNFPKNKHFLPPDTHTSGGKKCSFFGKFGVFCFLETPVLRFVLLLITDVLM